MEHGCKRCAQLAQSRSDAMAHTHGWKVLGAQTCHATHAGVVVARSTLGMVHAFFYLPGKTRDPFATTEPGSAHAIMQFYQEIGQKLAHYRKVLHGPHTLEVGDIITESRKTNGNFPRPHYVVGVPSPKHVDLIPCPMERLQAGWEGLLERPSKPDAEWIVRHTPTRHKVLLPGGVCTIDFGKGWIGKRWDGRPYHTSYDG